MKKHKLVTAVCATVLALSASFTSFAGAWVFDGPEYWQWKYVNDDGTLAAPGWQMIDGKWYHMDANSYLDVGMRRIDGKAYYLSVKPETAGQMYQNVDYLTGRFGDDGAWTEYESVNDALSRRQLTKNGFLGALAGREPWTKEDEAKWTGYFAVYNISPELFVPFSAETLGEHQMTFFIPREKMDALYDIGNVLVMQLYMASNGATTYSWTWKTDEAENIYIELTYVYAIDIMDFSVENWLH